MSSEARSNPNLKQALHLQSTRELEELVEQVDAALSEDHESVKSEAIELEKTVNAFMDNLQRVCAKP